MIDDIARADVFLHTKPLDHYASDFRIPFGIYFLNRDLGGSFDNPSWNTNAMNSMGGPPVWVSYCRAILTVQPPAFVTSRAADLISATVTSIRSAVLFAF